jgi:hypothetical protein
VEVELNLMEVEESIIMVAMVFKIILVEVMEGLFIFLEEVVSFILVEVE